MLFFIAVVAIGLVPISFLVRHSATWGPAERTENMLFDLYRDACMENTELTIDVINNLLETPRYEFLKQHRDNDVELHGNELAWFSPNSKYSIGICKNGLKPWIVNGRRTGE